MDAYLFFGGPYSNHHALDALVSEAARRGIPPSRIVSTGDLVAYCADPASVVAAIRALGIRFIRGNCEEQVGADAQDCGCGFAPGGSCDRASAAWYAHALRELDDEARAFLGAAPRHLFLDLNGRRLAVVHGSAAVTNRFVFAATPFAAKAMDLDALGVDGIVAGHCGLPFTQVEKGRFWHNPGALGMPANDGTPRVWFSVLRAGAVPGVIEIEHAALSYDCTGAAQAMRAAGLPVDYADTLETGLWPNCDILPKAERKRQGIALAPGFVTVSPDTLEASWPPAAKSAPLARDKFVRPDVTRDGSPRARVKLEALDTLWINTGTLCNLACENCYIESSPRNDRLAYISCDEVVAYLDEIATQGFVTKTIGFTGGEPFLNPQLPKMLEAVLARGFDALVLTNAMKPMRNRQPALLQLKARFGAALQMRVSLDHYSPDLHELERGPRSFLPTLDGLRFLAAHGFTFTVAGRLFSGEGESVVRAGFATLFADNSIALDAFAPHDLVLFPEMDAHADVPEITTACWSILDIPPSSVMCASSRMVVKRKGAAYPSVVACTLLPYEPAFDLGPTLASARGSVALNHPHCAAFCVLGGASCSG